MSEDASSFLPWLLPSQELEMGMVQHLELHYLGDQITSDEKLLSTYPAAIRRKVLRCATAHGGAYLSSQELAAGMACMMVCEPHRPLLHLHTPPDSAPPPLSGICMRSP